MPRGKTYDPAAARAPPAYPHGTRAKLRLPDVADAAAACERALCALAFVTDPQNPSDFLSKWKPGAKFEASVKFLTGAARP